MITNPMQLNTALQQLTTFRGMLEAMRLHLQKTNPALFPTASEGYLKRIDELQEEEWLHWKAENAKLREDLKAIASERENAINALILKTAQFEALEARPLAEHPLIKAFSSPWAFKLERIGEVWWALTMAKDGDNWSPPVGPHTTPDEALSALVKEMEAPNA